MLKLEYGVMESNLIHSTGTNQTSRCPACGASQQIEILVRSDEWVPAWVGKGRCLFCGYDSREGVGIKTRPDLNSTSETSDDADVGALSRRNAMGQV